MKYFRWANTLCAGVEEDFVCETCQDKRCFTLILYSLCFVTTPCAFRENYSPPQIRRTHLPKLGTPVCLIWVDEAFTETNFTPVFLSIMYDIYVATVSSLIKSNFTVFWKVL